MIKRLDTCPWLSGILGHLDAGEDQGKSERRWNQTAWDVGLGSLFLDSGFLTDCCLLDFQIGSLQLLGHLIPNLLRKEKGTAPSP
jgi:hypothetical protein